MRRDNKGQKTNPKGYLVNPRGDVINNRDNKGKMFPNNEIDKEGEIPAPFRVECHNFNPIRSLGDFDIDRDGEMLVEPAGNRKFQDKNGIEVSPDGWRLDEDGNLIDNYGHKKFDKTRLDPDGNLPNMFNYDGKPFDVRDVIGRVDKDDQGNMVPVKKGSGKLVDKLGQPINSKGYLVDN